MICNMFFRYLLRKKSNFPQTRVKKYHSILEIGLFKVMLRLFLTRFAREKTSQHDFKNQFLGIENSNRKLDRIFRF